MHSKTILDEVNPIAFFCPTVQHVTTVAIQVQERGLEMTEQAMIIDGADPKLLELIYNIVQDAQASGSVVQIITIWPTSSPLGDGESMPKGCKPKDERCPK